MQSRVNVAPSIYARKSLTWFTPFIQQLSSKGAEEPQLRAAAEQVFEEDDDPHRLHGGRQHVANHPCGGKPGQQEVPPPSGNVSKHRGLFHYD